jgi:hypothetical protein
MRLWMILGGLIGFLIGVSFGIAQGSAWPAVIWRASVATFLAGVVLRWWGGVWIRSLQQAQGERLLAAEAKPGTATRGKGHA